MTRDSFLTPNQLKVLELRARGLTQEEVAELIGTTRANVSIAEKRAKENIEKARKTLKAFEMLHPIVLNIPKETDLFQVPVLIYQEADKHGIKVLYNTTSLIGVLRRRAKSKISGNRVTEGFKILILRGGRVEFDLG